MKFKIGNLVLNDIIYGAKLIVEGEKNMTIHKKITERKSKQPLTDEEEYMQWLKEIEQNGD